MVRRDISLDLQDDISYLEVEAGRGCIVYVRANGPVSAVKAYIRPQPNRNIEFYWWLDETFLPIMVVSPKFCEFGIIFNGMVCPSLSHRSLRA